MLKTAFILILFTGVLTAQLRIDIDDLSSQFVLKKNRITFKETIEGKVNTFIKHDLNRSTEKNWISLFRELELHLFKSKSVDSIISRAADYLPSAGWKFQRAFVEAVATLTPGKYRNEIFELLKGTSNRQVFGAAAVYMRRENSISSTDSLKILLQQKFPGYLSDDILKFLYYDLNITSESLNEFMLSELLAHQFQPGKTIIYSLQRSNRRFPGLTIIKKPDGLFVRNEDSTIFYVKQLAYSTSNFPGYLSQGNTPQGILSIVGSYVSAKASIGPTASVISRIPFEVGTDIYYHNGNHSNSWNIEEYISLLPDSWQNYLPIKQAYFAGKTGRRLIVMHGSTDDLTFYENEPYYPLTPSKGCLTTTEIWDETSGKCIDSDQVKLMNAFYSTNQLKGFLVVVDIDDKQKPVTIEELLPVIKAIENN